MTRVLSSGKDDFRVTSGSNPGPVFDLRFFKLSTHDFLLGFHDPGLPAIDGVLKKADYYQKSAEERTEEKSDSLVGAESGETPEEVICCLVITFVLIFIGVLAVLRNFLLGILIGIAAPLLAILLTYRIFHDDWGIFFL